MSPLSALSRCLVVGALAVGCTSTSDHPPVYGADAETPDVPGAPDVVDASVVVDAVDVVGAVDVVDAATVVDAVDAAHDAPASDAPDAAPVARGTHSFATAAEVVELFTLHELGGDAVRTVVDRLHQDGAAGCPGPLTRADGFYSGALGADCHTNNRGLIADLGGRWTIRYTDACGPTPPQTRTLALTASAVTVRGTADGLAADVALDATVGTTTGTGRENYLWEGVARWTAVPEEWFPSSHQFFDGRTMRGVAVTRGGSDAEGYTFTGLVGVTEPGADAGAERTATFETTEPLRFDAIPTCFHPTAGRVVLHGAVDVVVTFASGAACAQPTWTRDGVPMGDVPIVFYGSFTLCGGTAP